VETLREKIISLELSNAEDDMESIAAVGASDAESESEDTAEQNVTASTLEEKTDPHATTDTTEIDSAKADANATIASTKKRKRKRSKKGRH